MTTVRDVMCPAVVQLRPETTMADAIKTLCDHDCGGAPVVAPAGEVLGMISELQFLDVLFDVESRFAPVSGFMTRQVHIVEPDDSLEHVAHMFELYGIRRLPVMEAGVLIGIVTRRDLIRHVLDSHATLGNPLEAMFPRVAEMLP
jgi:CBS domain-containing protein